MIKILMAAFCVAAVAGCSTHHGMKKDKMSKSDTMKKKKMAGKDAKMMKKEKMKKEMKK
jgi:uncharacterized lipoprotein